MWQGMCQGCTHMPPPPPGVAVDRTFRAAACCYGKWQSSAQLSPSPHNRPPAAQTALQHPSPPSTSRARPAAKRPRHAAWKCRTCSTHPPVYTQDMMTHTVYTYMNLHACYMNTFLFTGTTRMHRAPVSAKPCGLQRPIRPSPRVLPIFLGQRAVFRSRPWRLVPPSTAAPARQQPCPR